MAQSLDEKWCLEQRAKLAGTPGIRAVQSAVCRAGVEAVCERRETVLKHVDFSFSVALDQTWGVTNQRSTGRCWLFAGLTTLRVACLPTLHLADFELSQAFAFFWSKLERANYVLQCINDTLGSPDGDRTLDWLLEHPIDDGGQFDMFIELVRKHGFVPKAVFPETAACEHSQAMNAALAATLRGAAHAMRTAAKLQSAEAVAAIRKEALEHCFTILCINLGTPPERFTWQWGETSDKNGGKKGVVRRLENVTPLEFAQTIALGSPEIFAQRVDEYVSLVHDPRATSPAMRTFTVDMLGCVVGAREVKYLNVGSTIPLKAIALKMLQAGIPCWFGCDSGKSRDKKEGIYDDQLYDEQSVYGFTPGSQMNKADRLVYHGTLMTHAMVFTGVDVATDGTTRKWRVENSWGESVGKKGIFSMSDSWVDEHLFEIAAPRSMMPQDFISALSQEPIRLPAWDPMGSLAFWSD